MSDPNVPPPPSYTPPPPSYMPPPPAPGGTPPGPGPTPPGGVSPNRGIMLVLSYLGILALIPFVVEKNDPEVQWHAKHGLVLCVAEFILAIFLAIVTHFIPFAGCVLWMIWPIIFIFHIFLIIKATNGQRVIIPGISQYADSF
jgi:fumarate reductase subunit D